MVRLITAMVSVLMLLVCVDARADDISQYKLNAGDVININVFSEPDLTFTELRLTDAGTFSYPFLGEVKAKGKTTAEIEQLLISSLKGDYLVDPRVSVSVLEYRSFYISGEVKLPGGYPYQPGLNMRRAAALAGGLTERASTKRMTIVRDQGTSHEPIDATLDTPIMSGDTINIDQGFF